jgi:4-hydroxy-3-methylbut-2-enyl diphosphate reductase
MQDLKIVLINPRGFCAGVTRAVEIVERALQIYGSPIYVRHEIVHNKVVVNYFKDKGVVFVKELQEVPENANVIFSAHGVASSVEEEAVKRNLNHIDATCPLVKNVHKMGIDYHNKGYQIVLIGHKNHPETIGTSGRIPNVSAIIETVEDVNNLSLDTSKPISYITQTTLSLFDTNDIVLALKNKFPNIEGPEDKNICYATQNRQSAILEIINKVDGLLIVGSSNSSNSNRLKEIGDRHNKPSFLIDNKDDLPINEINKINVLAISAGASAPEKSVQEIIEELTKYRKISLDNFDYKKEDVIFHLPKKLR